MNFPFYMVMSFAFVSGIISTLWNMHQMFITDCWVCVSAAELKKKTNKPRRPSIRTLFGIFLIIVFGFAQVIFSIWIRIHWQLYLFLPISIDTPDPPDQPVQGSFINLLPTQVEVSESPEGSPPSVSNRPPKYPERPLKRWMTRSASQVNCPYIGEATIGSNFF